MAPLLTFDDVVIDFAARRVLRGGVEQPLEAKAFGVLAVLAGEPGRAFSRDELLDAVWGHRHVTPGVLNRVMTLLRHALGEDAHHPRFLHTLHGVGYRFDLPADAAPIAAPAAAATDVATTYDAASNIAARSTEAEPRRRASDFTPSIRTRRGSRWLVASALVVVAMIAIVLLQARRDGAQPASRAALATPVASPTLVVLPLKAIGGGDGGRVLADGLGEELIGSLAQIDGLRVIARTSTEIAAAESTDPAALVRRLGVSHALEGSLQQDGQRLRIRLRLVDAHNGSALWAKDFDRDATEVLALQRDIAEAVAASLSLKLGLPATTAKSGDAEFLRRYLAARALLRQRQGQIDKTVESAEAEFRSLIRERPDDARAHAGLALALGARSFRRPQLAEALRAEAMQEATIAQRLDPSRPEPWFIQATAACRSNRWELCQALLAKVVAASPDAYEARYWQAMNLAQLGYLDRAEALVREDVARDPINPGKRFTLARLLDTQGRHQDALAEYRRSDVYAMYGRWFNAVWRRDYAEAARVVEQEFSSLEVLDTQAPRLKPSYALSTRALVDPSLWPQAEVAMREWEQDSGLLHFNRVLMPDAQAHAAETIAKLDSVRERSYSSWDLLLWTKDLPWLRRDPAFQDYLRDNGILAYWRKHGFPEQCRPQGEGATCD